MGKEEHVLPTVRAHIDKFAITCTPNGHPVLKPPSDVDSISSLDSNHDSLVQSTYNIENSNDVVIGPVTHFHCPVTIIQKTENDKSLTSKNDNTAKAPGYLEKLIQCTTRRKLIYVSIIAIVIISLISAAVITPFLSSNSLDTMDNNTTNYDNVSNLGASQIIPRWFWGAREPLGKRVLDTPVKYVLVAHTASAYCKSVAECSPILQSLQSFAVDTGSPDIGYNFLIGGDGNVYVGRGWDAINYLQNHCISIAFIGNFSYDDFTAKMQNTLRNLIKLGVKVNKIKKDYLLISHSQTGATMSPGQKIKSVISKWEHFYTGEYIELPS